MGTETNFNCYKENAKLKIENVSSPKVGLNGSLATAVDVDLVGASNLYSSNGSFGGQHQSIGLRNRNTQASVTPVFIPIHIDEDVFSGAKEVLKVIRPNWTLCHVQFKKFTDGITNKLVGCFYNPPLPSATNHNGNDIERSKTSGNNSSISSNVASSSLVDDNNDSGNISETDTPDSEITISSTGEAVSESGTNINTQSENFSNPATDSNVVLVRVYGNKTDLLIDRKAETRNIQLLQTFGFAPTLFAIFKNGLVYDFVPGITLNPTSVLDSAIWPLVARRMAEMHRRVKVNYAVTNLRDVNKPLVPMLWRKMQSFFDLVPEHFSDPEKHKRVKDTFLPIKGLRDEFNTLYRYLERLNSPVVFAHNDLLLGNIVYSESRQFVNFIDFEYTDYNFQAFDIGNHFCEFAGVDEVDFSRYPKRDFQLGWLRVYLQEYLQRSDITDEEVELLYLQVNHFALAAHMFWAVWSLIQAEHSNIDFDYVDYAHIRYDEYQKHKSKLALHTPDMNFTAKTS